MTKTTVSMEGIIHITGEHDTGKTTLALECGASPDRICFFDDDIKGRATVRELQHQDVKFGAYHDLVALGEGLRQVELHEACLQLVNTIKPDDYDAIVWDTWTRFSKTFRHAVFANPDKFRLSSEWSKKGSIKGAEMNQEAQQYEARVINHLATLAPTVILVTHLKDHYLNNTKTGKQIPASSKVLARIPRFRIWLRQNPSSPIPIGLVLKRFDVKTVTDRGLRTTCILPRRLTPRDDDESLWDTIAWYQEHPIGLRHPTQSETPDEYELSILDGTLTATQKHTLELMLKAGAVSSRESEVATSETQSQPNTKTIAIIRELRDSGHSNDEVAKVLKVEHGMAFTAVGKMLNMAVADVVRACK